MESWGRAAAARGSSSSGSRGWSGRHGWASQAEGRCWEGRPGARWQEASWACLGNRAGEEGRGARPWVRDRERED